ncbi:MAG: sensor histidine kinase [Lysobacterales bacterium]
MTDLRRLRMLLTGFVLALALPGGFLIYHAYNQLQWQAFFSARLKAQSLSDQMDDALRQTVVQRIVQPIDLANEQRERLGWDIDPRRAYAGFSSISDDTLLGLFEVDPSGRLWSPKPPSGIEKTIAKGVDDGTEWKRKTHPIREILLNNELISPSGGRVAVPLDGANESADSSSKLWEEQPPEPAPSPRFRSSASGADLSPASPSAVFADQEPGADKSTDGVAAGTENRFDRLASDSVQRSVAQKRSNYGQVADLKLDQSREKQAANRQKKEQEAPDFTGSGARAEKPEDDRLESEVTASPQAIRPGEERFEAITTFGQGVDSFQFSLLDSGHFVLFRNIWRPEGRVVQGALFKSDGLLTEVRQRVDAASLSGVQVLVAYGGTVIDAVGASSVPRDYSLASRAAGQLLYRSRLSPPISSIELVYYAERLPLGAGLSLLGWLSLTLLLVLLGGATALYRLGLSQLQLARQQRDFVSAVSHELKTPLTSIRMYGEMLVQGLAPKERQPQYFSYIFGESERLSRLIDNVLQLARFDRGEMTFKREDLSVSELLDLVRSRIGSQVSAAGFSLDIAQSDTAGLAIQVDPDAVLQVFINLTDNALKFSRNADIKRVEIAARPGAGNVVFSVRDFGPGISDDQIGKIFRLFYRSESELTRDTTGTGIGLSLVQQLVKAMDGSVDVVHGNPGARFEVTLPAKRRPS